MRKKLIENTLSLATLSLIVASPSFASSFSNLLSSVMNSIPSSIRGNAQPTQPAPYEAADNDSQPKASDSGSDGSQSYSDIPPATASGYGDSGSSGNSTQDSSYVFSANVPQGTTLLHIQIASSSESDGREQVFVPVTGSRVSKRVYLAHGPGRYHISAWYSQNPSRFSVSEQVYVGSVDITNTDTRDLRYLLPSGDVQSDDPEIIALAQEITASAQNDAEKASKIHKWITSHIQYDGDGYFNGDSRTKVYDALTTLHSRISICYGYSSLYAALARASGLRTKIITGAIIWPTLGQTWETTGTSQQHAWNQVYVDGRWITLDTTWDSGSLDFSTHVFTQRPSTKYYDPSPDTFALDHRELPEGKEYQ